MKYYMYIFYTFLALQISLTSCSDVSTKKLDKAFVDAKNNQSELRAVLEYYKDSTLKLKAAKFLIENMPGHYAVDSNLIQRLHPYYLKHQIISEKYHWDVYNKEWLRAIDSLRDCYSVNFFNQSQETVKTDLENIKSDWLIRQIDLAFDAWQANSYTQATSFDDFCEYILPYKAQDGLQLDHSREMFFHRHSNFFNNRSEPFQEMVDSLLAEYRTINHNNFAAQNTPIHSIPTLELIRRGLCNHKCWFNVALLTATGMPAVTDFVPAWGNRNSGHSWNAIVLNGNTYPFEPFWDADPWKYKTLYNNQTYDLKWGKFRLPKVYRNTYSYHLEGPAFDPHESPKNIPNLFSNPNMIDVSSSYFETTDVTIELTNKIPPKTRYCYLCVYGNGNWQPIQWGLTSKGKATFKDMGKDIVYLPVFFTNGNIIPAANPFYLNLKGNIEIFKIKEKKTNLTLASNTSIIDVAAREKNIKYLSGTYILGATETYPNQYDTLCFLSDTMDNWQNNINLQTSKKYRYIHLSSTQDTLALNEITFYASKNDSPMQISNIKVSGEYTIIDTSESIKYLIDHLSATGACGILRRNTTLCFDLGKPYRLSSIKFYPYIQNQTKENVNYELLYWNHGWKSGGKSIYNNNYITFQEIPTGTLYRLKNNKNKNERIFMYDNGLIIWM